MISLVPCAFSLADIVELLSVNNIPCSLERRRKKHFRNADLSFGLDDAEIVAHGAVIGR